MSSNLIGQIPSLALLFGADPMNRSIRLIDPAQTGITCFRGQILISPWLIRTSWPNDPLFDPVRLLVDDADPGTLSDNELCLICYFYLNLSPFPADLMKLWLIESGTESGRATRLSDCIYLSRTEKGDTEPVFLERQMVTINESDDPENRHTSIVYAANFSEAFTFIEKNPKTPVIYTCFEADFGRTSESLSFLSLERINDTGFLVEDHAILIIGLSVTTTEILRITAGKWPVFTGKLLYEVPPGLRDLIPLNALLKYLPNLFERLQQEAFCSLSITGIQQDGKYHTFPYESGRIHELLTPGRELLPVYLRIVK